MQVESYMLRRCEFNLQLSTTSSHAIKTLVRGLHINFRRVCLCAATCLLPGAFEMRFAGQFFRQPQRNGCRAGDGAQIRAGFFQCVIRDIVLKGILVNSGMASFSDVLSEDDVKAIHAYLISRAHEAWEMQEAGK